MAQLFKKLAILSTLACVFSPSLVYADQFLSAAVDQAQTTPMANAPATNPTAATNAAENQLRLSVVCSVSNTTGINSALATAQTPQQAARLFAKIISPAIGQAIANAVQQAIVQTANQSTVNPPTATAQIEGWQNLILENGLAVELHWPSPGLATAGNLPVALLVARGAPAASGVVLAVSVNGTF